VLLTPHPYAKAASGDPLKKMAGAAAAAEKNDGRGAAEDPQAFLAVMAQKLAEKAAQAAVQVLAQLTAQHWMHHRHHPHSQVASHLRTDVALLISGKERDRNVAAEQGCL